MEIVNACLRIIHTCLYENFRYEQGLKFWALENPASGYLKRFLGKPALVFEPYEFGDPYTKKTAIWGEFQEPKKKIVKPREYQHNCGARDFVSCVEHFSDLKQIPERILRKNRTKQKNCLKEYDTIRLCKSFL